MFVVMTMCNPSNADAQQSGTRTITFPGGETVVETGSDTDHVIIRHASGEVAAESWCESGTFDAYVELFRTLKRVAPRGDRAAVAKLIAYPLRVYGTKASTVRTEAALLAAYDTVFTPQVLAAIRKAEPAAVFCRDGQGMLGDGVVWARVSRAHARVSSINQ